MHSFRIISFIIIFCLIFTAISFADPYPDNYHLYEPDGRYGDYIDHGSGTFIEQENNKTQLLASMTSYLNNCAYHLYHIYDALHVGVDTVANGVLSIYNNTEDTVDYLTYINGTVTDIAARMVNYLGPVTTPQGNKSANELIYMVWDKLITINSTISALGPSVDGIYTNSSLILAQEQAANTSLSSILSQDQTQTSHLANIRQTTSLMRDDIRNIDWTSVNINNPLFSTDGVNFSEYIYYGSYSDFYIKFNKADLALPSLVRIDFPIRLGRGYFTDLSKINLSISYGNYTYITDYYAFSNFAGLSFILNPFDFTGNDSNYSITLHLHSTANILIPSDINNFKVFYLNFDDNDYFTISNFILNSKRNEILDSYSAKFDHLYNIDNNIDDIVSILDKSTSIVQNDNEVNINTNISIDEVDFVNSGIRRFRQFFNTGITAAAFGIALDSYAYDQFFHQEVTDLVQTVNSEYTEVPLVINTWPII